MSRKRFPCVVWQGDIDRKVRLIRLGKDRYTIESYRSGTSGPPSWRPTYAEAELVVWTVLEALARDLPDGPLASPDDPAPKSAAFATA